MWLLLKNLGRNVQNFVLDGRSHLISGCGVTKGFCTTDYGVNIKGYGASLSKYIRALETEYEAIKSKRDTQHRTVQIQPVINALEARQKMLNNMKSLKELLQDEAEDIRKLAEEERDNYEQKLRAIDCDLEQALLNIDNENNYNAIVLEVNAGVGGQEAMLFANELFDMYCNFVDYKGWQYEIAEFLTTELGGIRHASLLIDGRDVHRYFKYEAGVHRVQRIPATEKSSRIHTSTVSVLALPQPSDIQINLQSKDLKIETKRATGAGGQHVNTTDSAVRIVHLPTGIAVECQVDRSQIKNREIAMQRLKSKIYQDQLDKQQAEIEITKKSQVRTNYRNEKIRTYNFSQDRITDHRLHNSNVHNLKAFFQGSEILENLSDKLHTNSRIQNLLKVVSEFDNK